MEAKPGYKMPFRFAAASGKLLEVARTIADSDDADERLLSVTVIEVSELSQKTSDGIYESFNKGTACDVKPYLDRDMAPATEAAKRSLKSNNPDVQKLAALVLDMASAIFDSREAFFAEIKRSSTSP